MATTIASGPAKDLADVAEEDLGPWRSAGEFHRRKAPCLLARPSVLTTPMQKRGLGCVWKKDNHQGRSEAFFSHGNTWQSAV